MAQHKKAEGMDLGALADGRETAVMTIHDPATDEPMVDADGNEFWIELFSMDSKRYKEIQNNQVNRRIQKMQRQRGQAAMTAEQQDANSLELLAKCTKAWHVVMNGEAIECTEKNARDLYERVPPVREQADAFMHDRKNFLTNSSGS